MPGQTGSAQIHAQARPDLCWQAAGNGSPVTLEHYGSAEGQQWTLAGHGVLMNRVLMNRVLMDGVLMNGNGYCLQAGPTLAIGFDGQCDGQAGQLWTYRGATGQFASQTSGASHTSAGHGSCAVVGGPLVPGAPVASGACDGGTRWSLGSGVIPVQPAVSARPQATPGQVAVHPAVPAAGNTAGSSAGAGAAGGGGLLLAALLAGLLLMTGATLVFFGRWSRRAAGRGRPRGRPGPGGQRPPRRRPLRGRRDGRGRPAQAGAGGG